MSDSLVRRIGDRLRRLRQENELTLRELADRSNVAPATIQRIETHGLTPSISILEKIARGFNKEVTYFLIDEEEGTHLYLPRESVEKRTVSEQTCLIEELTGPLQGQQLSVRKLTIYPGGSSNNGGIREQGERHLFCVDGELSVQIGQDTYALSKGESLHFKAILRCRWENRGSAPAVVIFTSTPPPYELTAGLDHSSRKVAKPDA